jgi:transposase
MANRRIDMRKIRQVLRLALESCVSKRTIAKSLGISRDVVSDYVTRAKAAGLQWPLPADLDDAALDVRLFPVPPESMQRRPEPVWETIHQEMKAKGATLQVLHEDFLAEFPLGIGYSHFCNLYRQWLKGLKRYMRQVHNAGERAFVDYAGPTMKVVEIHTGEVRTAQIFVGILGASNYTYAEAHWSQKLPNWIAAHTRMFEFFGGVPQVVVCDNLKSAVIKASRTEPVAHPVYQHLAEHYDTVILPARPRKPKDKAKVENAVRVVERWILFRLRKRTFTSLSELNAAISELLVDLNDRPFQKITGCRRSHFEELDKPVLKPLPEHAFEYTEFRRLRIGRDGFFEVNDTPYNAPYMLSGQVVDLRITAATIEILHRGRRVASQPRGEGPTPVIQKEYMNPADSHFGHWNAEAALEWAISIGTCTQKFFAQALHDTTVKEQGYRAHSALKRMQEEFGAIRLEAACGYAIGIGAMSIASLRSILRKGLDTQAPNTAEQQEAAFDHSNVRGAGYYH